MGIMVKGKGKRIQTLKPVTGLPENRPGKKIVNKILASIKYEIYVDLDLVSFN